jgi:DNA-binding response OmpR family regulator
MRSATVASLPITRRRRFLVVEDEEDLARLIGLHLQDLQAQIVHVGRGDIALERAIAEPWDLIILDLRLPGLDGLDVCRELRSRGVDIPIMMLTARAAELDRVLGLELGADDYLAKPFSSLELTARAKALLRRSERKIPRTIDYTQRTIKHIRIDKLQRSVTNNHQIIELTAREFDLLWFFACNLGRVFNRTELLDQVW